jgi:hypothetical protein
MAQRLRIGPGAGSPFLVSVAGVNADGSTTYNNLIFNGNCPPLRIWSTGFITATQPASGALPLPYPVAGPAGFTTPGGTYPLFLTVGYIPVSGSPVRILSTPFRVFGGGGGGHGLVVANTGQLFALNNGLPSTTTTVFVNYCILRNYG